MAIKKLTFDGALNTAKTDADLNYFLTNKTNGIVYGIGGNLAATSSGGAISFGSGYVSVYGRRVYVEEGTSISVSLTETKYGYVILGIDTSSNEATLYLKEGSSSSYPSIQQNNLMESDGLYEVVLCSYYKTTTSLTLGLTGVDYIYTDKALLNNEISKVTSDIGDLSTQIGKIQSGIRTTSATVSSSSNKVFKFYLGDYANNNNVLFTFIIGYTQIAIPALSLRQYSSASFYYNYYSSSFSQGLVEISGSYLYVTLAETTHTMKRIYISY